MLGVVLDELRTAQEPWTLFVAGCDRAVEEESRRWGVRYVATSPEAPSPALRVAEAMLQFSPDDDDIVVIVQGDEPMVELGCVSAVVSAIEEDPSVFCANLVCPCSGPEIQSTNTVKSVANMLGLITYLSRSPIPNFAHGNVRREDFRKQCGVFAFRWSNLWIFLNRLGPSRLEASESIELLRLIDHGLSIREVFWPSELVSVDTKDDISSYLRAIQNSHRGS